MVAGAVYYISMKNIYNSDYKYYYYGIKNIGGIILKNSIIYYNPSIKEKIIWFLIESIIPLINASISGLFMLFVSLPFFTLFEIMQVFKTGDKELIDNILKELFKSFEIFKNIKIPYQEWYNRQEKNHKEFEYYHKKDMENLEKERKDREFYLEHGSY